MLHEVFIKLREHHCTMCIKHCSCLSFVNWYLCHKRIVVPLYCDFMLRIQEDSVQWHNNLRSLVLCEFEIMSLTISSSGNSSSSNSSSSSSGLRSSRCSSSTGLSKILCEPDFFIVIIRCIEAFWSPCSSSSGYHKHYNMHKH